MGTASSTANGSSAMSTCPYLWISPPAKPSSPRNRSGGSGGSFDNGTWGTANIWFRIEWPSAIMLWSVEQERIKANHPVLVTAARWRMLLNLKGHGWAARGEL